jgi:hypothetical protein
VIDLLRALAVYAEVPGLEHSAVAKTLGLPVPTPAEHTQLFVLQLFPYASVQLGPEGKLGGVALDRIGGFFAALGCAVHRDVDHLVTLLGAYATLLEREQDASAWSSAREALLVEHLLSWVPVFTRRVIDLGGPAYSRWSDVLDEVLRVEAARAPTANTILPSHLAAALPVPDPRQDPADAFLDALLAPGRSGMIIAASDLARAARDIGIGGRVAERRFVMRALFDQEAGAVLRWLSATSRDAAAAWKGHWLSQTPTGEWWQKRATETADLLDELAADAASLQGDFAGSPLHC